MQPRILFGTFALTMGLSGLASAGGVPHGERITTADTHVDQSPSTRVRAGHQQTKQMQRALIARNLYKGPADGVWGPKTESALRNFQTQNGLEVTGELNGPTARALGIDATTDTTTTISTERQPVSGTEHEAVTPAPTKTVTVQREPVRADASSTGIQLTSLSESQGREMQQRLQLLGFYRGPIDGKLGDATRAALASFFQRQAELAREGVVSNATISLFGTDVNDVQPVAGRDAHPVH